MSSKASASFRGLAALGLLLCGALTIAACNAVMGIEPAELDSTVGAVTECYWPQLDPSAECNSGSCESAASSCKVDDCLRDADCREKLKDYRKCAGDSCENGASRCMSCIEDNTQAAVLVRCLNQRNCGATNAYTLCESYCSCMAQKCPEDEPGGSGSCLEVCANGRLTLPAPFDKPLPAWRAYCFWDHCERVNVTKPNDKFHCHHAVGIGDNCKAPPAADPDALPCPYPQGHGNSPCDNDDDCCATCDEARGVCEAFN